jgi:hypothetical protein
MRSESATVVVLIGDADAGLLTGLRALVAASVKLRFACLSRSQIGRLNERS